MPLKRSAVKILSLAIITYLLALIEPINLKIKCLYLDREFFCVPVIRWLQALNIPFVMPVIIRGKQGGTRNLIKGRCSYKTTYTMASQQYGTATFDVWVVCKYKKGKRRQNGIELFARYDSLSAHADQTRFLESEAGNRAQSDVRCGMTLALKGSSHGETEPEKATQL